jgi:hypothetical protein
MNPEHQPKSETINRKFGTSTETGNHQPKIRNITRNWKISTENPEHHPNPGNINRKPQTSTAPPNQPQRSLKKHLKPPLKQPFFLTTAIIINIQLTIKVLRAMIFWLGTFFEKHYSTYRAVWCCS